MTRRPLTSMLWAGLVAVALAVLLCGCSPRVVTVTDTQRDTLSREQVDIRTLRDTLIVRDSVAVIQRGDTVYHTAYRWRDRLVWRTDTALKVVYRSSYRDRPVVTEVTHPLPWWRKALEWIGGSALILLAAAMITYFKSK